MAAETSLSLSFYIKRFFSGTLLSRISGLGRDLSMAFAFGDHPSVAAFMIAFRFSNLLRRLIAEGPFQLAFVPFFEGLRTQDSARASFFFRRLTLLMALLLILVTGFAEGIMAFLLSSWQISEANQEIITLTAWLAPAIIFICLYGLNISLLQCYDCFFISSFAPFVCNSIWILAALYLRNVDPQLAMPSLAKFVAIGFIGQWLVTLPQTLKKISAHWREWLSFSIPSEVKELAKILSLSALGVGATQINAFIDVLFARYADLHGPVYLWYSIRIQQLALAIFGIACVTTIVPRLSRAIKNHDFTNAYHYFSFSYQRIITVMLPCMFALIALGGVICNLIYGRGSFSESAVSQTTLCLWAYGLGLIPTTMVMLFSATLYAYSNFRIPTVISIISMIINLSLNALFVLGFHWGALSTAIATSLSAWLNCLLLQHQLRRIGWRANYSLFRIFHMVGAGLFAFVFAVTAQYIFSHPTIFSLFTNGNASFPRGLMVQFPDLLVEGCFFLVGLIGYAYLFRNQDLLTFFKEFLFQRKKTPVQQNQS